MDLLAWVKSTPFLSSTPHFLSGPAHHFFFAHVVGVGLPFPTIHLANFWDEPGLELATKHMPSQGHTVTRPSSGPVFDIWETEALCLCGNESGSL